MRLYHRDRALTIYAGEAQDWAGAESIDLVLTNPYGPMPAALRKTPMLIHQWAHRKHEAERWAGVALGELVLVSAWNDGRECVWAANIEALPVPLEDLAPEPGGWYPIELPLRLLSEYSKLLPAPATIWDGFMGRGTVGAVTRSLGWSYVGIERLDAHLAIAREYLGLEPCGLEASRGAA